MCLVVLSKGKSKITFFFFGHNICGDYDGFL